MYKYAHKLLFLDLYTMLKNNPFYPAQLQRALIPVCKMAIKFGLQSNEFQKNIQRAYIKAAEELLNESSIPVSNQALAIKTGMDRRTVSEYRKNRHKAVFQPMNKMDLIISELQKFKSQKNSTDITEDQLISKIDAIYAKHIRAKAVIRELLANEILSRITQTKYQVNINLNSRLDRQKKLADEVDVTTKRLFQTFYKKMFVDTVDPNLNQSTICSSKIPNSKHIAINDLVQKELIQFQKHMQKFIEQFEAHVPEDTYANIGFSQFQFDSLS